MKFPWATAILSATVILVYFLNSSGTLYLPENILIAEGFQIQNPFSLFTHIFLHIGILHLMGNLIPLIVFCWLLESKISSKEVVAIFLVGGAISSVIFSLTNQGYVLVGSSAAIASVMGASVIARPKAAIILMLILPFLTQFFVYPIANYSVQLEKQSLKTQTIELNKTVQELIKENKTTEAEKVNKTLQENTRKYNITKQGEEREKKTPVGFVVHIYGALFGVAYMLLFRKKISRECMEKFDYFVKKLKKLGKK